MCVSVITSAAAAARRGVVLINLPIKQCQCGGGGGRLFALP